MIVPEYRLPTVDEVLAGEAQGGVPRPQFVTFRPADAHLLESRSFSAAEMAEPRRSSRWQAIKALLRIIFGRKAA